jgi:hypothetical protein
MLTKPKVRNRYAGQLMCRRPSGGGEIAEGSVGVGEREKEEGLLAFCVFREEKKEKVAGV